MRPNTNELNALLNTLHKVNDCVVMPAKYLLNNLYAFLKAF